jgi:gamma-glutamyltranspeptidase/glutathione hydrolase
MKKLLVFLAPLLLLYSCKTETPVKEIERGVITQKAMVVSARAEASKIGSMIMEQGGNVFDAMIATDLALNVAYPFAGSLGGGGFMVYRTKDGEYGALDYREMAPGAATHDMYLDEAGNVIPGLSTEGSLAVGVPGGLAGMFAVHEKFGSIPMKDILKPVIDLARNGYVVTEKQAGRFDALREKFIEVNNDSILYATAFAKAELVKNEALAQTLERIAAHGKDEFYKGETGQKLVDYLQSKGGIMTMEDLANYEAKWRTPVSWEYDNLKMISMAPPSSGGVCLAQIMQAIEPYDISQYGHNSLESIQLLTEAERRAYADRSFYLGDPDFVEIPIDTLISDAYAKNRMDSFQWDTATKSSEMTHSTLPGSESMETTHFSAVDQFGNAVAVTVTLNGAYGSKLYVDDIGIFLNNEMDDFSSKPGVPNMFGLIGAEANKIEPGKRMLSSMTPTLVEKDGKFWMTVGTPGGSTIITSVLQTVLNVHEYGMGMQEAVNAPRFHHQWLPDVVLFEPNSFDPEVIKGLEAKGYSTNQDRSPIIGKVDGILVLPDGTLEGGADRRGDDAAVGF